MIHLQVRSFFFLFCKITTLECYSRVWVLCEFMFVVASLNLCEFMFFATSLNLCKFLFPFSIIVSFFTFVKKLIPLLWYYHLFIFWFFRVCDLFYVVVKRKVHRNRFFWCTVFLFLFLAKLVYLIDAVAVKWY